MLKTIPHNTSEKYAHLAMEETKNYLELYDIHKDAQAPQAIDAKAYSHCLPPHELPYPHNDF